MEFLKSIRDRSQHYQVPFEHWEFQQPLTDACVDEINRRQIENPKELGMNYDGTRAIDGGEGFFRDGIVSGGQALPYRCFVQASNSKDYPHMVNLINELKSKDTYGYIGELLKKDLTNSYIRIEIICDRPGFWLKPHCDIKEKLLSCLVFTNPYYEAEYLGTDLYDKNLNKVKTIPYKNNSGYFFSSNENSWHGCEKKVIKIERRAVQINYVTFKTDWKV